MLSRTINTIRTFLGLTDTPSSYAGQAGKVVKVKSTEDGLEFGTGGGASAFIALTDTFASYTGLGGRHLRVKTDETGVEAISDYVIDGASFLDSSGDFDRDIDGGAFI